MGLNLWIDWSEVCVNPADFEKLVKLLLLRLHPDGEVIDGSGGDGGREFQIPTPAGPIFYEAKSFIGRVSGRSPNRRAQVERSLKSASQNNPAAWHLVVPIDHNPTELDWFNGLRAHSYPFIQSWHGQTWLEEQLAQHPDLFRSATQNRLLEYVRRYKIETEALAGGTPDLIKRHQALAELGDELSPDWRPIVSQLPGGGTMVEFEAKHPDAETVAPITLKFGVDVPEGPDTAELRKKIRSNLLYGTTVQIPGRFLTEFAISGPTELGLSHSRTPQGLVITASPETENLPMIRLSVRQPSATFPIATLPFQVSLRTAGPAGGTRLTAYDGARSVQLIVEIYPTASPSSPLDMVSVEWTIQLNGCKVDSILPSAYLPGLRLLTMMKSPNVLMMGLHHSGALETVEIPITADLVADLPSEGMMEFIENLAVVQDKLRHPFPVPDQITVGDVRRTARLRELVEGNGVAWTRRRATVTMDSVAAADFGKKFPAEGAQLMLTWDDLEEEIAGNTIHVGPVYMVGDVAVVVDGPNTTTANELEVTFELVNGGSYMAWLGQPPTEPDAVTPPPPPGRARVLYRPHEPAELLAGDQSERQVESD